MLSRNERLNTADFAVAFAQGRALRHPLLQVRVFYRVPELMEQKRGRLPAQTLSAQARAAFVVPKKTGKATLRNRLRRRVRERYRLHPLRAQFQDALGECDLIFMTAPPAQTAGVRELDDAIAQLLRRAARAAAEMKTEAKKQRLMAVEQNQPQKAPEK
jgi:ribonuclease P protein component